MRKLHRAPLPPNFISSDLEALKPGSRIRTLQEMGLRYVYRVLKTCDWNRTRTAEALDINCRSLRFYVNRIRAAGVEVPDSPQWRKGRAEAQT